MILLSHWLWRELAGHANFWRRRGEWCSIWATPRSNCTVRRSGARIKGISRRSVIIRCRCSIEKATVWRQSCQAMCTARKTGRNCWTGKWSSARRSSTPHSEERNVKYAIRLLANDTSKRNMRELLTRRKSSARAIVEQKAYITNLYVQLPEPNVPIVVPNIVKID